MDVIKKKYPILDENRQPSTYPTFASQVFGEENEKRALWQDGKGFYADDSAKFGGKLPEYYIQPRNLLDNSDFTNPVNQRGITTMVDVYGYTLDRWLFYGYRVDETYSFTLDDGYVSLANGKLEQKIESYKENVIYTCAAMKTDGTLLVSSGTFNSDGTSDSNVYMKVSSDEHGVVGIKNGYYTWAALYEGEYTAETLPPYVPKGYGAELAECQRYYCHISSQYGRPIGTGMTYGASNCRFLIPTPVTMRTVPTVIATPSNYRVTTATGSQHTVSSIEVPVLHGNGVSVTAVADGAQSNYVCSLFMATNEAFALSADL